jgi:esterase/lipase
MFFLLACSSNQIRNTASKEIIEKVEYENSEWIHYENSYQNTELQSACLPRKLTPAPGIKVIAKVLLVHGFTACPQQYFELAKEFNNAGYIVYLFTLPGHGKLKHFDGKDNYAELPTHNNFEDYSKLAEIINNVALADKLPSSIGGLSVGGAVALEAASKIAIPYQKLILFSPFFKIPSFFKRNIIGPIIGNTPGLKDNEISWGEGCHDELLRGRQGLCEFTLSHVYTVQIYGQYVMALARDINKKTSIQIVGVERDKGADVNAIKNVAKIIQYKKNNNASICFYPKSANHSLLSRFDSPDENKYWLPSLIKDSTRFITDGIKIPKRQMSHYEKGFLLCDYASSL